MSLVLDTSVTLAWVYTEETTPAILNVFERICVGGAWVPGLWHLEVANALQFRVAQQRITAAVRDAALADLSALPIHVDPETDRHAWGATLKLAIRQQLTVYDAAFLELAQRRRLPLATLDRELRQAATAEGVPLA
jgi:predicted nucleic acid-binding protein